MLTRPDPEFTDAGVAAAFAEFPTSVRPYLLAMRQLIFDTAAQIPDVGPITETLKWGQPSYLTSRTRSGSTVRLGVPKDGGCAIYVHCQTTLISGFQEMFPDQFDIEGARAVRFQDDPRPHFDKLHFLIAAALTYHLNKR